MSATAPSAGGGERPILNDLASRQNEPDFLALQSAWKLQYARAVRTFYLQAILTVLAPIVFGFVLLVAPAIWPLPAPTLTKLKAFAGFYALLIVLIDDRYLDQRQQKLKREAAIAQEMFDRDLFGLGWGKGKPKRLDGGVVRTLARRWQSRDRHPEQMKDWYPVVIAGVPLHVARVLAQRAAIRWDRGLREPYVLAIGGYGFYWFELR